MKNETRKVLIVTTVSGFVPQFEMNNVKILQSMGYQVHYAANYKTPVYTDNNDRLKDTGIVQHQIDFDRSPFSIQNKKAYHQLLDLLNKEKYALIHCHTPMGAALTRVVVKKLGIQNIIYTAHGFHFYKGASLFYWLLFYPVERILAKSTDVLVTINQEDYCRAKKFRLRKNGCVKIIPGVGIDLSKNDGELNSVELRKQLGLRENNFVIISVGELSKRKNHQIVIRSMAKIVKKNPNIVYLICGSGRNHSRLQDLIEKYQLGPNVKLLGYRTDVNDILRISDCFVFPSLQEGLPVAILEAMNASLPVIASDIRGNRDLVVHGQGGFLVNKKSMKQYIYYIGLLAEHNSLQTKFGKFNKERVIEFGDGQVKKFMKTIYETLLLEHT